MAEIKEDKTHTARKLLGDIYLEFHASMKTKAAYNRNNYDLTAMASVDSFAEILERMKGVWAVLEREFSSILETPQGVLAKGLYQKVEVFARMESGDEY